MASLTKREGLQEEEESRAREELSLGYIAFGKLRDPGQRYPGEGGHRGPRCDRGPGLELVTQ